MEERQLVLEQHQKTLAKAGENLKRGGAKTGEEGKADAVAKAISGKRSIVAVRKALREAQVVFESFAKKVDTGKKGISRRKAGAETKEVEVGKKAVAGKGTGAGVRGRKRRREIKPRVT